MSTHYWIYRQKAIENLGSKCSWLDCNITDPTLLDIDHKEGDGGFERKNRTSYQILKSIAEGKNLDKFQLLCCNHHRLKSRQNRDHIPYLYSFDKLAKNINEELKKKSWRSRLQSEIMKTTFKRKQDKFEKEFYEELKAKGLLIED